VEIKVPLSGPQQPVTGLCPEPDESSPHPPIAPYKNVICFLHAFRPKFCIYFTHLSSFSI